MSEDYELTGEQIHCIEYPTEYEALRQANSWIRILTEAITTEMYGEFPQFAGVVHANGSSLAQVEPMMFLETNSGRSGDEGKMELLLGGALAVTIMRNDPEENIGLPIYAYFLCADGYSALTKDLPKKRWWERNKAPISLETQFNSGSHLVSECITLHHITRTHVTLARRNYRFHPIDGFEWDEPEIFALATTDLPEKHPYWAFKWGEGPWKD